MGWCGLDSIDIAQDREQWMEGSCEDGIELSVSMKCWEALEWLPN
jgi:hypothetical protein